MAKEKITPEATKKPATKATEIAVDMVAILTGKGNVVSIPKETWENPRHQARLTRNKARLATDQEIKNSFVLDSIPSEKIAAEKEKVVIP